VYSDFASEQDFVFSLETEFTVENGQPVGGHFLLLPNVDSLQVILEAVRQA
jgi:chemotaxis protein CheC